MPVELRGPNYDPFAVQARLARSSLKKIIKEGHNELPQAGCQHLLDQLFLTFDNLFTSYLIERGQDLELCKESRHQGATIAISMVVEDRDNSDIFLVRSSRTNSKTGEEYAFTALEFALDKEKGWTTVNMKTSVGAHNDLTVARGIDGQEPHFSQVLAAGVRIARDLRWLL